MKCGITADSKNTDSPTPHRASPRYLYPHEESRAEVFTAGERATIAGVGDLLSIVDTTELLYRAP